MLLPVGFSRMLKGIGCKQMATLQGLMSFSWKSDVNNDKKDWAPCGIFLITERLAR